VTVPGPIGFTAAVANGAVYFYSQGVAHAFDAASGAPLWQTATLALSGPAVANRLVYYGGNGGGVFAYDAASGVLRWTASHPARPASDPTVANGVVYVTKDVQEISAYDAVTGAVLWIWKGQFPNNAPTVVNGSYMSGWSPSTSRP
jgi:outer membrane protein assembly factor BamB